MSVPTAKKLRETYGPAIDATVGMLHRVVKVDASDLSALLDMAEEAEEAEKTQHIADIELMRQAVANHDAKKNPTT